MGGHSHPANPGLPKKVKARAEVRDRSKKNVFEPAASVVEDVLKEMVTTEDVNLPKPANLVRAANRFR